MKSMRTYLLLSLCVLVSATATSANQTHVNTATYNRTKAYTFTYPSDGILHLTGTWNNKNADLQIVSTCRFSNSAGGAPEHIANIRYDHWASGSGDERIVKLTSSSFEGTYCDVYVWTTAKNTATPYRLHMQFTDDGGLSNAVATPKAELIAVEENQ